MSTQNQTSVRTQQQTETRQQLDAVVVGNVNPSNFNRKDDGTPYFLIPVNVKRPDGNFIVNPATGKSMVMPAQLLKYRYEKNAEGWNIKEGVDESTLPENTIPNEGDEVTVFIDRIHSRDKEGNIIYDENGNPKVATFLTLSTSTFADMDTISNAFDGIFGGASTAKETVMSSL